MSNHTWLTCAACDYRSGEWNKHGFFSLPEDPTVRKVWLENCGVDPSTNIDPSAKLCIKHFTADDYIFNYQGTTLKKDAIPSIKVLPKKKKRRRHDNICLVCGKLSKKNYSFFRVPFDSEVREEWLRNVGMQFSDVNPTVMRNLLLCDSHFYATDIIQDPHTKTYKLRQGAMPIATWSSNMGDNRSGILESPSKKSNDDEDFDSTDRDVAFVSCRSNVICSITLEDDKENEKMESLEPKISTVTPSQKSSQFSKAVSVSNKENILNKKASDKSNISSLKEKKVNRTPSDLPREEKFTVHPPSKRPTLQLGSMPIATSPNMGNNRSGIPEFQLKKIKNDEDFDSSDRKVIFVSSCSSNATCTSKLNNDEENEKPLESKTSKMTSSKKSSQYFEAFASTKNILSKSAQDVPSINLTCEGPKDSNSLESMRKKNLKRIRRLKENRAEMKKELLVHQSLLNHLIKKKLVTKEGKKIIKKFRQNFKHGVTGIFISTVLC